MKILTFILLFLIMVSPNQNNTSKIEIPSIFSDNMVLQQNSVVTFWGVAAPEIKVKVNAGWGESVMTTVNTDGLWSVKLKTPGAGGPYEINLLVGDSTINYKNVLTGEVWLCSGQSNMEMTLSGWPPKDTIINSSQVIANAYYPEIRLFTVQRAFSNNEEFNITGEWEECNPASAAAFSATAYFFGKKLYEELNVPIGLINSSWGGTPVESWISGRFLESVEEFRSLLNDLKNSEGDFEKYKQWLYSHPVINPSNYPSETKWENLDFNDGMVPATSFVDTGWSEMNLPILWENEDIGSFDGVVWFRKEISIPESWVNKDLILELGPIDDMDRTYVNGNIIGAHENEGFWNSDRVYKIPVELVKNNVILIAIRVIDTQGGGGIYGDKEKLNIYPADEQDIHKDSNFVSLSGTWKYFPVAEYRDKKFFVFDIDNNNYYTKPYVKVNLSDQTPTSLYNGMIHPLIPYSIKGVIWYQGEANTGNPEMYTILFPLMISNWRNDWKSGDFPFYYVQIAPYDYGDEIHSEKLREVQLKSLSVLNTGMVVTLDIGNPANIHPANKKDVGERLARWALAKTYNKQILYSGPLYKSMNIDEGKIILSFDYTDDGLVIKDTEEGNNFVISGEDRKFRDAIVRIEGNQLIVSNPEVKNPVAVRYAWSNTSQATLFSNAGLPASSFRTDSWEK